MGQSRITSHTRRHISRPKVVLSKKDTETEENKSSFRPVEEISIKPTKVQKPTQLTTTAAAAAARRSSRSTNNKYKQTCLSFGSNNQKNITKNSNTNDESEHSTLSKRKIETDKAAGPNKKQKTAKKNRKVVEKAAEKTAQIEVLEETVIEEEKIATTTADTVEAITEKTETVSDKVEKAEEMIEKVDQAIKVVNEKEADQVTPNKEETQQPEETYQFEQDIELKSSLSFSTCSLVEDDSFTIDTPSPTSHSEPMTPPFHSDNETSFSVSAPYKTILSPADKARISDEKAILMKLRKALDIVITDRIAHNQPVLYHKVESVLRNSTRRTIVIGHLCQIMSVAPELYGLHAKEIRDFGGKATEAYLIELGKDWIAPLVGKDLQKRSDILEHNINHYFDTHKEPYATIPKKELPKLDQVVNKKDWISEAKLPPGVKSLITAHERVKEIEAEKAKPKPKPKGSVTDRLAALKARLKERKG